MYVSFNKIHLSQTLLTYKKVAIIKIFKFQISNQTIENKSITGTTSHF